MRYWQSSTKSIKEIETTSPFWTLHEMNRNVHPKDQWSFLDYGTVNVSLYSTVQGPTDGYLVWLNDQEKWIKR